MQDCAAVSHVNVRLLSDLGIAHPEDLKSTLRKSGITMAGLASELGCTRQAVWSVIHGRSTSLRIERRIKHKLRGGAYV